MPWNRVAIPCAVVVAGAAAVVWLLNTGAAFGQSDRSFNPEIVINRLDVAVMVHRMLDSVDDAVRNGSVAANYGCDNVEGFADMGGSHASKVSCLAHIEVIRGYEDRTFRPGSSLSRQQMAAFIYRILDVVDDKRRNNSVARNFGCSGDDRFEDVNGTHSYAIHCLADIAVITGYRDGTFRPTSFLTRQHASTLVYRALDLADDRAMNDSPGCDRSGRFADVSGTHAEAVNCLADLGLHGREPLPDEIPPPPLEFNSISALNGHVCGVLKDSGEARCWGSDYEDGRFLFYGQAIPPEGAFKEVSAGGSATCGIRPDQTVECWGGNEHGKPTRPKGKFTTVAPGGSFACGIRTDRTVRCWGYGSGEVSAPVDGEFTSLSAGGGAVCGVRPNRTVICFSERSKGSPWDERYLSISIGYGEYSCGILTSRLVNCRGSVSWYGVTGDETPPPGRFAAVSTGYRHACGIRLDGTVECWGADFVGETSPPPGRFASIASGLLFTCGLRHDGTAECWGSNDYGKSSPPAGWFVSVTRSERHGCGLRDDGTVTCWGDNEFGQATPVEGYVFTSVSAGDDHTCALTDDYRIRCWGSDLYGQSTPPTTGRRYFAVTAGDQHTCAFQRDHSITCWGRT